MSAPVFLAEGNNLLSHEVGSIFVLDGEEGRHAGVVQRRQAGERIDIVDGKGARLSTVVESTQQGHLELRVEEVSQEPANSHQFVLVQALAKGDRDEMAIEASTEIGVDGVVPWQADRSIVVWRGPRAAKSHARWVATIRAATKQARRARIPFVEQPVDSKGLCKLIETTIASGGAAIVLHEEATTPIGAIQLPPAGETAPQVLLIVGPEGGMTDREVESFQEAGAQLGRLGPHVLRTSTAGPVALSVLSATTGRWS